MDTYSVETWGPRTIFHLKNTVLLNLGTPDLEIFSYPVISSVLMRWLRKQRQFFLFYKHMENKRVSVPFFTLMRWICVTYVICNVSDISVIAFSSLLFLWRSLSIQFNSWC